MILINVTTNLKLGKPTNEEKYDIKVPNANMDIIDSNIKRLQDADRNFATNENLQAHTERRNNPHEVTKQQIGLDKVVNRQQIYGIPGAVTTGGIPVFDGNGYTVRDSGFTIGKSVPSHAVFTDTTYGIADDNAPGIIKPSDSIHVSSDGTASVADDSHSHDTQYYGKAEAALLHEKNLQDSKKYTDLKLSEHKAENTVQKQIVASLPTSGINTNTIYLVPKTDASTHDHYNEYINLTGDTNGWEFLGNTYIDLTDYYNKSEANRIFFLNSNISQSNENSTNKVPSSAFLYSIIQQKNSQIQNLQNEISEINSNLSTKQDANTAITTSNIGSQNVNYANSAGSVPWESIAGRPSLSSVITTVNTQTKEFTVEASTILSVNLPYTVPSGYIALGVIAVNANTASSAITRFMLNGNNVLIELRNITSGQQKITISAVVLCKIYT